MSPCTAKGLLGVFVYCFWPCWVFVAAQASPNRGGRGLLSRGSAWPSQAVASSVGCGLEGVLASVVAAHGLHGCGSRALEQSLSSPGAQGLELSCSQQVGPSQTESTSPVLASRPFTTEPPGKPRISLLWCISMWCLVCYLIVYMFTYK